MLLTIDNSLPFCHWFHTFATVCKSQQTSVPEKNTVALKNQSCTSKNVVNGGKSDDSDMNVNWQRRRLYWLMRSIVIFGLFFNRQFRETQKRKRTAINTHITLYFWFSCSDFEYQRGGKIPGISLSMTFDQNALKFPVSEPVQRVYSINCDAKRKWTRSLYDAVFSGEWMISEVFACQDG